MTGLRFNIRNKKRSDLATLTMIISIAPSPSRVGPKTVSMPYPSIVCAVYGSVMMNVANNNTLKT